MLPGSKSKTEAIYDIVWQVIHHHIYHILFIRSEELNPAHTTGDKLSSTF